MWISVQPSQLAPTFDLRYRLSECNPWKGPQLGADFRPERSRWFQYIPMIFHKNQTKDTVFFFECYIVTIVVSQHVPMSTDHFLLFFPNMFLDQHGNCRCLCSPGQRALQAFLPQLIHRKFLRPSRNLGVAMVFPKWGWVKTLYPWWTSK